MGKITVRNIQVLINNDVLGHLENECFLYNFSLFYFFFYISPYFTKNFRILLSWDTSPIYRG